VCGIKKIYLAVALKYFEYMKIPPSLFLLWTIEQYNLKALALDGWVYIEMRRGLTASEYSCQQMHLQETDTIWIL